MGKFFSRFALGAALGLLAIWLWGQLNQDDDDDFEDDDEVIEIPIGNNKQASGATGNAAPSDMAAGESHTAHAKVEAPATSAVKVDGSAASATANLEWVEGIGQAFNRTLNEADIKTDQDLANASVEQLRATGIQRNDEEFASWIKQARQRTSGK